MLNVELLTRLKIEVKNSELHPTPSGKDKRCNLRYGPSVFEFRTVFSNLRTVLGFFSPGRTDNRRTRWLLLIH